MSLPLVEESSRRVGAAFSQMKKLLSLYDSKELDGLIYDTARMERVFADLKDVQRG